MTRIPILILFLVLFIRCNQDFHVRGAKQPTLPHKKLMLGMILNRDYKTPLSIAKDFRDLFAFELLLKGYSLVDWEPKRLAFENEKILHKSTLPSSLRMSAGETLLITNQFERQLEKIEIKQMLNQEMADYFVQGVISIQSNNQILDKKDYNLIFLNVYDNDGNLVSMLNSYLDNQILCESEHLRQAAHFLAQSFGKSLK